MSKPYQPQIFWPWFQTKVVTSQTDNFPAKPSESQPPDPLDNKPWLGLAAECVALHEEMDRNLAFFQVEEQRELATHVCLRLQEILERAAVELIVEDAPFDRALHQPDRAIGGMPREPLVAHILSPGFRVGRRVLGRARVELPDTATPSPITTHPDEEPS
ncbi:hypothetical protein CCP4SC76_5140006 [Gammaproteobacteria bacterium]